MKTTFFFLLFALATLSYATESNSSINKSSISDSTETQNIPECIEETEPHFVINGRKFWIVVDNKRSPETYDESSEIYQYFSQIPESLFSFKEGISHAAFIYKEQENTQAIVEVGK